MQQKKQEVTLDRVRTIAGSYHEVGARLEALALVAEQEKVRRLDLKIGTITGVHFYKIMDSLARIEADAKISIRKRSKKA
jgi:hypothetical protein